jgi:O-methyltransferase
VTDRDLHLFDTFEGMTEPTDRDVRITQGKHADELLSGTGRGPMAWARPGRFVATLDDVREGFASVDYPEDRVHLVPGRVEDTVPQHAPETIAILRLDTDWYESTKHELTHLYQRLAPGGVLIIDDYGTWHGAKEATDEFLDETGEPLLLTRVSRAAVAVKPGLRSVL